MLTLSRLGVCNIIRVALYRMALKIKFSAIRKLGRTTPIVKAPFYQSSDKTSPNLVAMAPLFGYHSQAARDRPPDWLTSPLNGRVFENANRPFWDIADFDSNVGDIKQIWELSRFGWVLDFALAAGKGNTSELNRLNMWLEDWLNHNPPYQGPNWKCGQEASIRVLHLIAANALVGQDSQACPGLCQLITLHLQRISPTIGYAKAQDNNHGTSEAAALFVGGHFLLQNGQESGHKWAIQGRKFLENRVARLIGKDGSFSQYSVNYHRMMLDALSISEWWRRRLNLPTFSAQLQARAQAASMWLYRITDPNSGDVPNIGANDGSHLLNLSQCSYRDYRPSVSLAYALWYNQLTYDGIDVCELQLSAMNITRPQNIADSPQDDPGIEGGFAVLSSGILRVVLRHPRFRFRPSQSDALHLDVWFKGNNILRDGGSFSYNSGDDDISYFGGVRSHNTVQFDARDQMPRLGRFLLGDWLKTRNWHWGKKTVQAGYEDSFRATHIRRVEVSRSALMVIDKISNYSADAILRWRFSPNLWNENPALTENEQGIAFSVGNMHVTIRADSPIFAVWETGYESRFYLHKTELPVLKVLTQTATQIKTDISWLS